MKWLNKKNKQGFNFVSKQEWKKKLEKFTKS